ncbi:DUF1931 family protein [Mycolicibacterium aichiense]|uniref:DUF1931 family protein n=1 Tax=Mycolicibacterium aichiense TaxID=1799 RepID=UPI003D67BD8D
MTKRPQFLWALAVGRDLARLLRPVRPNRPDEIAPAGLVRYRRRSASILWPGPHRTSLDLSTGGTHVTHPSGIPLFERFFRSAASIKIDKNDIRRFREFVDEQIDEIAIAGRNSAKWNGRDVIVAQDLPITKGVQERMREFDKFEEAEEIRALLRQVVRQPPGDVTFGEDAEDLLPELFGGLSIALARSFRLMDPTVSKPSTEQWNRAFTLFRLVF